MAFILPLISAQDASYLIAYLRRMPRVNFYARRPMRRPAAGLAPIPEGVALRLFLQPAAGSRRLAQRRRIYAIADEADDGCWRWNITGGLPLCRVCRLTSI